MHLKRNLNEILTQAMKFTEKIKSKVPNTKFIVLHSICTTVAARHVLNVGGRHTTFSCFRPLAVFSLA